MYIPKHFEERRTEALHHLMQSYPFASFVTLGKSGLIANHIPFLLDAASGSMGTLRGHVSRGNPVWKECSQTVDSLVIFEGPTTYISPSWYPSKHQHGKAVPTWNYAIVHAYGLPRIIEDPTWLLGLVSELSALHESSQAVPWKVSDAPKDFIEKQLSAIVGIEIPISKISGKWKASQNRPVTDQLGVVAGLEARENEQAQAMAQIIRNNISE